MLKNALLLLVITSFTLLLQPISFANDSPNHASPTKSSRNKIESPAPVELVPDHHQPQTFTPSSQTNYDETVTIKAPPPEKEEQQSIRVKRFGWLNIKSNPLNPAQQNR
jgi:hypothetical protein